MKADDKRGADTTDVTITVTDVNEKPEFADTTTTREVAENTATNTDFGDAVEATDPDDDSLTYSLDTAGAAVFNIDSSTGQLRTKAALDRETKATYTVTVSVRDSKDANGNPDTATDDTITVTINITDVNEPPTFPGASTTRSIAEDAEANDSVGAPVEASDPEDDSLTYALGGTDASSFTIDAGTRQIKVGSGTTLDYEGTKKSYTVTVSVKDDKDSSGNPATAEAIEDTITVTINVTNVNETPEVSGTTTFEYAENGTGALHTYTATDPDSGTTIIWSLTGADGSIFSITGGRLTFNDPPDYEAPGDDGTNNVYNVNVVASDGELSDTLPVTITVTNVEEPGTVTLSSLQPQVNTGVVATLTDPDIVTAYDTWKWGDFLR